MGEAVSPGRAEMPVEISAEDALSCRTCFVFSSSEAIVAANVSLEEVFCASTKMEIAAIRSSSAESSTFLSRVSRFMVFPPYAKSSV